MEIQVRVSRLDGQVPATDREVFARWATEIFAGTPAAKQFTWVDHWAYQVAVYADSSPVSHLRIVDRTVLIDAQPVRVGGVADVMTPAEFRGQGFAGRAMKEAAHVIFELMQARLGLLLCAPPLVRFYACYGWQMVDCPVSMAQPGGSVTWPQCTMLLVRPGETWAPRSVDLCGLPW